MTNKRNDEVSADQQKIIDALRRADESCVDDNQMQQIEQPDSQDTDEAKRNALRHWRFGIGLGIVAIFLIGLLG